jgi:hypothetical protein
MAPNRQFKEASFVLVGQAFLPVRTGWKARATDKKLLHIILFSVKTNF